MKLLILTQKVDINDDVLGFFHGWIAEFAKHCEKVTVICLFKGEYDLPENVRVLSLGKEQSIATAGSKVSRPQGASIRFLHRIIYIFKFYRYIISERRNYNEVFVHMNQIYIILGGLLWRAMDKKIGLWYTHKSVNLKLRIAEKLVNVIFTASPESFRLPSKKVNITGHGIDTNKFNPPAGGQSSKFKNSGEQFKIITIGRISPVKDYETLIKAAEALTKENVNFIINIVGGSGRPEQESYFKKIKELVFQKKLEKQIRFLGPIPNKDIAGHLKENDSFVNMSHTGSLDKAILEAMASGLPVISCNEAYKEIITQYQNKLTFSPGNFSELADKIKNLMATEPGERLELGQKLKEIVFKQHSLNNLIVKILDIYKQ